MDWRDGLGCLLRDLGLLLKLVGTLLVTWAGTKILDNFNSLSDWWACIPMALGALLMLAGAAAAILILWQKVVRVRLDVAAKSAEFSPVQNNMPEDK